MPRVDAWDQWGHQQDVNSVKVINSILTTESPDLVVLNGDLITGENGYLENATVYMDQIVGPMVRRGLTWASTYGNHDYQYNISGAKILERERRWPNSRTKSMVAGPEVGTSNYYLPVYDTGCADESACAPELVLWFFDSRGGQQYQVKGDDGKVVGQPNWVHEDVAAWWYETSAELAAQHGRPIPALAFVHIPVYASLAIQHHEGVDPHKEPGVNDDVPVSPQAQGYCADGVNNGTCDYGGQDLPFMRAAANIPGVLAVFSGHDHGDTWCAKWDALLPDMWVQGNGINLCFGQHSGYGGYGNWERGARQVLVTKEMLGRPGNGSSPGNPGSWEADTWIRLESGNVVGSVSLNATYGQDRYPATNSTFTSCPTCNWSVISPMPGTRKRR